MYIGHRTLNVILTALHNSYYSIFLFKCCQNIFKCLIKLSCTKLQCGVS